MNKYLILIGGGGHCKSVIDVAESAGYNIVGILGRLEEVGKTVLNYKIVGVDDDIPQYIGKTEFVITVGFVKNPILRIKLYNRVKELGGKLATIVASSAHISDYAIIGEGTVIMHNALVNAGAKVGNNVIINSFANIEHDTVIGNQCHISTGVMVNGTCNIGNNVFIGSRSVVVNNTSIGDNIVIGAGSVVCKNLFDKGLYVGNPARFIK